MWGAYLVRKRRLMINKRMEHAVDYFSKAWTKVVAHKTSHPPAKPPVLLRLSAPVLRPLLPAASSPSICKDIRGGSGTVHRVR